jgi:hypothetical protein
MNLRSLASRIGLTRSADTIDRHQHAIGLLEDRMQHTDHPKARAEVAEVIAEHYEKIGDLLDGSPIARRLCILDPGTARMFAKSYEDDATDYRDQGEAAARNARFDEAIAQFGHDIHDSDRTWRPANELISSDAARWTPRQADETESEDTP